MGIRVIKVSGEPLQAADVIVRYIGYYINTVIFGSAGFGRSGTRISRAGTTSWPETYVVKG